MIIDYRFMRYEEFALSIWNKTDVLFEFLGLPLTLKTREFLLNHTEKEMFSGKPKVWNTFRSPKEAPFHWKTKLSMEKAEMISKIIAIWVVKFPSTKGRIHNMQGRRKV